MKALKHFKTITHHRHKVIANCFRAGIGAQGLRHDLSKYSPTEFLPGAKYFIGTRSPNELEREDYLVEMFCDRVGASKIYGGERYDDAYALNYFLRGKGRRAMHPETSAELERLLTMLSEQGEEKTFAEIRRCVKKYGKTANY